MRELILNYLPDIDGYLEKAVNGTAFFKGNVEDDYFLALIFAISFPVMRWILDGTVFDWIGRSLIHIPSNKKSDDPNNNHQDAIDRLHKFRESAYKCSVQILFTAVLLIVAIPKPWFTNTWLYWSECSRLPCEVEPTLGERFVYCLELGFYFQAIPMIFLWETKRKDRWEMVAHHIATVILIAYSYYLNLTRVGVMVLVCHEANDIFLEGAKMARYIQASNFWTTGIFVVFMLSWFATRIYAFAFVVIKSTLFESYKRAAEVNTDIEPHGMILNGFLLFLYVLHVYWSYLIVRIAVRQLMYGDAEDIREKDHPDATTGTDGATVVTKGGVKRRGVKKGGAIGPALLNPEGTSSIETMPSQM